MTYLNLGLKTGVISQKILYNAFILVSYNVWENSMDNIDQSQDCEITVLIAEPPGPCRWAVHHLLQDAAIHTRVVDSGVEAIWHARQYQPAIVVLSQSLTDMPLAQITEYVLRASPASKIFLLAETPEDLNVTNAIEHARRLVMEGSLRKVSF